ncbi:hypothetical protein OHR68_13220 [Spirillospora sp. NBC_00431]
MAVFLFGDPVPPPGAWPLGLAKNPAAPAPIVFRLLDDERLAEPAANNPAHPVETMHGLLDRAGVAPGRSR